MESSRQILVSGSPYSLSVDLEEKMATSLAMSID